MDISSLTRSGFSGLPPLNEATKKVNGLDSKMGSAQKSQEELGKNMSTFLKLLTTQLTHQDPTSPMETSDFTDQLVKYNAVEQQIGTNHWLEKIYALSQKTHENTSQGVSLMDYGHYAGAKVDVTSDQAFYNGSDDIRWAYDLGENQREGIMMILNENGDMVDQRPVVNQRGRHEWAWSGKNFSGENVNPGMYRLVFSPSSQGGQSAPVNYMVNGKIDAVFLSQDGRPMGKIGPIDVDLSQVKRIYS